MKTTVQFAVLSIACCAATQALACFTVYDRNNRIVYNAMTPPVDMSRPLHETVPQRFPGGHLVNNGDGECPRDTGGVGGSLRVSSPDADRSPLLTDAKTAESLGLRATPLEHGAVVVRERPDSMRPGAVIADTAVPPAEPTAAMGASAPPARTAIRPLTSPEPRR